MESKSNILFFIAQIKLAKLNVIFYHILRYYSLESKRLLIFQLLSLKIFILDFEHILIKGLKYYSWYTIKAENFCDTLSKKLSLIYSFKENIQNTIFCIQNILLKIKSIDWFDFPKPVDEINFKNVKVNIPIIYICL